MGKKITFIGFLLALVCLIPAAFYTFTGEITHLPSTPATIIIVGFPLFALISFIGMIIWAFEEIRRAKINDRSRGE